MKKVQKERISPPAVGGTSLLVVFALLCLTVFALLSLSTVQAERRLSDSAAESCTAYYSAELEAKKIYARLIAGEEIPGLQRADGSYAYGCTISDSQTLVVELEKTDDGWQLLRWQSVAEQCEIDDSLPVWDGR